MPVSIELIFRSPSAGRWSMLGETVGHCFLFGAVLCFQIALSERARAGSGGLSPCGHASAYKGVVVSLDDVRTIVLEGGARVQLSGILPPLAVRGDDELQTDESLDDAFVALQHLVVGKGVILVPSSPPKTRYGIGLAHVFVDRGVVEDATWVQGELVRLGLVRAWEPVGQSNCFEPLRALEHLAIEGGKGLWSRPAFWAVDAQDLTTLLLRRGTYQRIRGRVITLGRQKKRSYINFGTDWKRDFTISIPNALLRDDPEFAKTVSRLEGQIVEIRGWLDVKNGPIIELERPSDLRKLSKSSHMRLEGSPSSSASTP